MVRLLAFLPVLCLLVACETKYETPAEESVVTIDRTIYDEVDELPQVEGGFGVIGELLKYPASAREAGVEGQVVIDFVVDDNGYVTDPVVLSGVNPDLDGEALRVVRQLRFSPGRKNGKAVRTSLKLPITFKL